MEVSDDEKVPLVAFLRAPADNDAVPSVNDAAVTPPDRLAIANPVSDPCFKLAFPSERVRATTDAEKNAAVAVSEPEARVAEESDRVLEVTETKLVKLPDDKDAVPSLMTLPLTSTADSEPFCMDEVPSVRVTEDR